MKKNLCVIKLFDLLLFDLIVIGSAPQKKLLAETSRTCPNLNQISTIFGSLNHF